MSNQLEQDQERWEQDQRMTKQEAAIPPVRSESLLAAFSEYWHNRWPHQTREVQKLERSAHYIGCRDAFIEGARAAFLSRAIVETDGYVGGASRLAEKWLNEEMNR